MEVEAYRFGVEAPPLYLVWCEGHHGWCPYTSLGEQQGHSGMINLVEAKTPWNQSLRQRGPIRR
jgi:hypothetical protein